MKIGLLGSVSRIPSFYRFINVSFNVIQWDPIYLDPKDPEHLVYRTALVSTQVDKTRALS